MKIKLWSHGLVLMLAGALCVAPAAAQFNFFGGDDKPAVKQIAYFHLAGSVSETPMEEMPFLMGEAPTSLKTLIEKLKKARQDENVVAVILNLEGARPGFAQMEELHAEIRKFAAVDKEVYVHADFLDTRTYVLASSASRISVVPTGMVWLTGLYGEAPYLKGLLDKLGVQADFEQLEEYKSAGEMFMRSEPSPKAAEMTDWLLDGIYDGLIQLIAGGRELKPEQVRKLIDGGPYLAEDALKVGLIDAVEHREDFIDGLKQRHGDEVEIAFDYGKEDTPESFMEIWSEMMQMFMSGPKEKKYTEPSVAIVYVEGEILPGSPQSSPFGTASGAFSTPIRKALDRAAADDSVKAVVLRVDSPGGSAFASEIILNATRRVAAKKPLIVSMGNVAASGGYYVSCAAQTIFAGPSTVTASIGVVAGKLATTGGWDKLGVNWDPRQRGKMAAIMSTAEPWSETERAKIRAYMGTVYGVFKDHVKAARGKKLAKPIEEIAGGRVFTGAQALELGLVDHLGGLYDAVRFAAKEAGLGDYDVRVIPEPPNFFDMLMQASGDHNYAHMGAGSQSLTEAPLVQAMLPALQRADPLRVEALTRALRQLDLIQAESVILAMPPQYVIR